MNRFLTFCAFLCATLSAIGCNEPTRPVNPYGPYGPNGGPPVVNPFTDPASYPGANPYGPQPYQPATPPWMTPANPYTPQPCPGPNCPPRTPTPSYPPIWNNADALGGGGTLGREIDLGARVAPVNLAAAVEPKRAGFGLLNRSAKPSPAPARATPKRLNPADYGITLGPGETLLQVGPTRTIHNAPPSNFLARPPVMPRPDSDAAPTVTAPDCPTGTCPNVSKPTQATKQPTNPLEQVKEGRFACQRCGRAVVGDDWHEVWADDDTPLTCLCEQCWATITPAARMGFMQAYAVGLPVGSTIGSTTSGDSKNGASLELSPVVLDAIKEAANK
jgi:hypothetical protein